MGVKRQHEIDLCDLKISEKYRKTRGKIQAKLKEASRKVCETLGEGGCCAHVWHTFHAGMPHITISLKSFGARCKFRRYIFKMLLR